MGKGTLYVHRPVQNAWEIIDWAKDQGLRSTLEPQDLHVTVIYSTTPFDWPLPKTDALLVRSKLRGEMRTVRVLGDGAVCLIFDCVDLHERFDEMIAAGAESKWGSYQAHITLTYDPGNVRAEDIEPYGGRINLGPEVYGEVSDSWADTIVEKGLPAEDDAGEVPDAVRALVEKYAGIFCGRGETREPASTFRKRAPSIARQDRNEPGEDFEFHCRFAKADMDKGQAFGFFSVATVGKKMVADGENQRIPAVELEKAAYDHVMESRIADEEHDGSHKGILIESMLFTPEKCAAMVKSLAEDGITAVIDIPCVAWWGGHQITDADVRKKVKSGEYKGFSIGGKAMLTPDPK